MRAAIVENGVVVNVVELPDGWSGKKGEWQPQTGERVVMVPCGIGDAVDDNDVVTPKPQLEPEEPEPVLTSREKLTKLLASVGMTLDELKTELGK